MGMFSKSGLNPHYSQGHTHMNKQGLINPGSTSSGFGNHVFNRLLHDAARSQPIDFDLLPSTMDEPVFGSTS